MPDTTPYYELKKAIQDLETEKAEKRELLKAQFKVTYESIKPFNILRNVFSHIIESPETRNNLLLILIPLATGFLGKKAFAGTRQRTVIRQAGIFLLDRLNRYIYNHPEVIKTISRFVLGFCRKKKSPGTPAK